MEKHERSIAGIRVLTVNQWDPGELSGIPLVPVMRGSTRKADPANRPRYLDLVTAFDIESSRLPFLLPEQSVMYIWQFCLRPDTVIIGRTWSEFLYLVEQIRIQTDEMEKQLRAAGNKRTKVRLMCFVHNLSYEFQFLRGIWHFEPQDVFAMEPRKILKCNMGPLELRCSYLQTNLSLGEFTRKFNAEHIKRSGEKFDYSKIRYPWTPMTDREIEYCIVDVAGLVEAMRIQMDSDHDTLETLPMTSTGYVRRDAKKAMQYFNSRQIYEMQPDRDLYEAEREAFRGGNTHASRFMAGRILKGVQSWDRSSSYPDVLVNYKFPMRPFWRKGPCSRAYYDRSVNVRGYAAIIRIAMIGNVRLRDPWTGCPYLATDKCRHILTRDKYGHGRYGGTFDNGRILACDYLETTCTDIDFRIIDQQYTCDRLVIYDSWYASYGYLPEGFRQLVREYYQAKTTLKGDKEQRLAYDKIKARINALYGMCAMDPVRQLCEFIDNDFKLQETDLEAALAKNARKNFLVYQWGVWVTAWARWTLQLAIDLAGDQFVYTDTDSVKFIGDVDFTELNDQLAALSWKNHAYAVDHNGEIHYMGVYEHDGSYGQFVTLGAKKYAYTENRKIHITVAGVNKKLGAAELRKMGGMKAFRTGITFVKAGGTESLYNDDPKRDGVQLPDGTQLRPWIHGVILDVDGRQLEITSNVVIRPSTYTLDITEEYRAILGNAALFRELYKTLDWY